MTYLSKMALLYLIGMIIAYALAITFATISEYLEHRVRDLPRSHPRNQDILKECVESNGLTRDPEWNFFVVFWPFGLASLLMILSAIIIAHVFIALRRGVSWLILRAGAIGSSKEQPRSPSYRDPANGC